MNEFLMQEAKDYQEQMLTVTYLLQNPKTDEVVAYFSLLCDTIKFEEEDICALYQEKVLPLQRET